jgi:dihydroflavonol-4-reductase
MRRVNVHGTRIVLEEAARAGVLRTVHTSSIARFGGQGLERQATEESPFALGATGDLYSRTKAEAHALAVGAARRGEPVVIVAPCGPIGPGDVGPTPTGRLLLSAITMPAAIVTRSATCFADVRDMAFAHLLAAKHGDIGETYLLGTRDLTMAELVDIAHRVSGVRRPVLSVPYAIARGAAYVATAVARGTGKAPLFTPAAVAIARLGLRANCTKAMHRLGMEQSPIERAVADALRWFAMEGYIADRRLARTVLSSSFRTITAEPTSAPRADALS